jgi:hypothetical protein
MDFEDDYYEHEYNDNYESDDFQERQDSQEEYIHTFSDYSRIQGSQNIIKYTAHHRFVRLYQDILSECSIYSKQILERIDELVYVRLTLHELQHRNPYGIVFGLIVHEEPNKEQRIKKIQQLKQQSNLSEYDIVRYYMYVSQTLKTEKLI